MMKGLAAPAFTASLMAFGLAACGGGATNADADGDGSVSSEEARAAVEAAGSDLKPLPGQYRSTIEFISADIPGAPQGMKDMMGSAMDRSFEFCLTPEEADRGFEGNMTEGQDACTIKTFEIDGNDLDMTMTCGDGAAGQMNIAMDGNVTPTRSDMNMKMEGEIPQLGKASFEMSMVQERIGDCSE